jgi:hypothetical protein
MEQIQKVKAIKYLRPNAEFVLRGDEIEWLDKNQTQPTGAEIEAGWVAYEAAQKAEAEAKAQAKAELLERLGITADEAKLLLA